MGTGPYVGCDCFGIVGGPTPTRPWKEASWSPLGASLLCEPSPPSSPVPTDASTPSLPPVAPVPPHANRRIEPTRTATGSTAREAMDFDLLMMSCLSGTGGAAPNTGRTTNRSAPATARDSETPATSVTRRLRPPHHEADEHRSARRRRRRASAVRPLGQCEMSPRTLVAAMPKCHGSGFPWFRCRESLCSSSTTMRTA